MASLRRVEDEYSDSSEGNKGGFGGEREQRRVRECDRVGGLSDAILPPPRALDRRLQENWARDARKGPKVLMSLRVDFGPMG